MLSHLDERLRVEIGFRSRDAVWCLTLGTDTAINNSVNDFEQTRKNRKRNDDESSWAYSSVVPGSASG